MFSWELELAPFEVRRARNSSEEETLDECQTLADAKEKLEDRISWVKEYQGVETFRIYNTTTWAIEDEVEATYKGIVQPICTCGDNTGNNCYCEGD